MAGQEAQDAQDARARVLELYKNIDRPLLALPERGGRGGADIRYFVEEAPKGPILWLANKGKEAAHFNIAWAVQGGRAMEGAEGGAPIPPIRLHLSPMGRMSLSPPKGFKDIILTDIRAGQDEGPFIDEEDSGEGNGGARKGVQVELQRGAK
jgi:hypothetical protein